MSRNDADDFALRLYDRIPGYYRVTDAEQGLPLLALLRVVGEQVSSVREDLDALWDNFFIETCDDWVVPYIGALVGTNLLAEPVGESNRLDVWNTVVWRRSKGTPAMLQELASAVSGWPVDLAEFYAILGWSQNLNHLRLDRPLTPELHDPYRLSLLGRASDSYAHAVDVKPASALDEARVTPTSLGVPRAGWGTSGRYAIKNVGLFSRRLQTFTLTGVTPASAAPGLPAGASPACFTFDPLYRDTPLFIAESGEPLTRAAFDHAPWVTFGTDVAVRQFGVLLASEVESLGAQSASRTPFSFGGSTAVSLHPTAGMRLPESRAFELGAAHFVITAQWQQHDSTTVSLGALSTLHAARREANAYHPGSAASLGGRLIVTVQTGRAGLGWADLPPSPPARFPGTTLAVRAVRSGALNEGDALYVYLPAAHVMPGDTLTYYVAEDGSTYTEAGLDIMALARASDGPVYPPRPLTVSTTPAQGFVQLNRKADGMHLLDPARFGGAGIVVEAEIFTGAFQPLGAVATTDQPAADHPELTIPDPWPAFTYGPGTAAASGALPDRGLLCIHVRALSGDFVPACELIVTNRYGESLLIYLPQLSGLGTDGARLFVADDGATYAVPPDSVAQLDVLNQDSFSGLPLGRASAGQVMPIPGLWPLQQRAPVAVNLCRCERNALLVPGELGIDPELGRFALAPEDPAIGTSGLTVDYVEAFSDRVGARTFDRLLTAPSPSTRLHLVAQSGDAASLSAPTIAADHIHATLADALAHVQSGDVIELADSRTYAFAAEMAIPTLADLTIRAGPGQRPCLTYFAADGTPGAASVHVTAAMSHLELNGLLISGGPVRIEAQVDELALIACTVDPRSAGTTGSLIASDADLNHRARYLLCRCITGGLRLGAGVAQTTAADSIVDQYGEVAIGGALPNTAAQGVQLERVTVLGRIRCDVLNASESLLCDLATVDDQQAGCIRFSRYERGSVLPRRYSCVPSEETLRHCPPNGRCLAPLFNSRHFGRPDYGQLSAGCPAEILAASEVGSEVGAFAGLRNTVRLQNLEIKLREFLPAGLSAVIIAET